jgi:hypothetical protein
MSDFRALQLLGNFASFGTLTSSLLKIHLPTKFELKKNIFWGKYCNKILVKNAKFIEGRDIIFFSKKLN